jgi:type I restriction enzyme S subunit
MNVPKLRFPEFREMGEWEEKTLGECLDYEQPTPYLVAHTNYSDAYKTPVLTAGKTFILGYTNEEYGIFSANLPVIIFDDFTTATQFVSFPFKAKSSAMKILKAKNGANIKFMYEILQVLAYEVGAHERHWISTFAPMTALIPSRDEQQKIANCLSSLDELVTAETQTLEAYKQHKKGLMQQLFPQTGETTPRVRFAEFREMGEWEGKLLKKIFSIFQGFAFSSNDSVPHGIRWLKIADVSIQQMNHDVPSYLPIEHREQYKKFLVHKGDYVLALTRPILSGNLKMAPIDDVFHGALLNQRVGKLVTDQNILFVYYLLQTSKLISDIDKSISGSEPPNLSTQQIEDLRTRIPLENEQQKIANCLSSLDELITAQTRKIDALKTHKKGLMQGLFPNPSEEVQP